MLLAAFAVIAIGFWIASARAQQTLAVGPFTDAQASAGQAAYAQSCASCHANSLAGSGEAPALAGSAFVDSWGGRTTQELYNEIRLAMPPENPNTLGPDTYAAIVAFLLEANGAQAGTSPLTADTAVTIRLVATGRTPVAAAGAVDAGRTGIPGRRAGDALA
jgi:mono/diheme cytochrome c family protein